MFLHLCFVFLSYPIAVHQSNGNNNADNGNENNNNSLFPTMPRHNYIKAQPFVKELCKRHNLPYPEKPLGLAFRDVIRALKSAADLWKKVSMTEREKST
ncbi:Fatty acid desaturase 1 [Fasciolopsis buskii]|uniref:Fatty acid desaturase 1 n=1 Tax=Fasciolopsis buskii TaxID=27845 RepID=A0A8E0RQG5_9TREM|nr:Fatty acid desaturase 1 [Fasciolopsis buski]